MKTLFDLIPDLIQTKIEELTPLIESLSPIKYPYIVKEIDKRQPWREVDEGDSESYLLLSLYDVPCYKIVEPIDCDLPSGAYRFSNTQKEWKNIQIRKVDWSAPGSYKRYSEMNDVCSVPRWFYNFTEIAIVSKNDLLELSGDITFKRIGNVLQVGKYEFPFTNSTWHDFIDFTIKDTELKKILNLLNGNELKLGVHKSNLYKKGNKPACYYYYFTDGNRFIGECREY